MKNFFNSIWKIFLAYFGQGLLFTVPITATIYVLYILFLKADELLNLEIPGLGILVLIVGIFIIGLIGKVFVSLPIFNYFNHLIKKAPLISIIYLAIKDLLSAFVGNKRKFTKPVLVKLSKNADYEQIGFLTEDDLGSIGISGNKVAVYAPFPYSFMGNMFIVPAENITPLNIKPTEAMKFVISGGVSTNPNEENKSG